MIYLGLIDQKLCDDICKYYKMRHTVHLSAKLKDEITVEVGDTRSSFRRINGFCEYVTQGLKRQGEPV